MGTMTPVFGGGIAIVMLVMLVFMLLMIVIIVVIASAVWHRGTSTGPSEQLSSPADLLRARYARGEINREHYRQSFLDLLQDRYARDGITLDELGERASTSCPIEPIPAATRRA